jgi:hypothetical protein
MTQKSYTILSSKDVSIFFFFVKMLFSNHFNLKKNHLKLFLGISYSLESFQIYPNIPIEYGCM